MLYFSMFSQSQAELSHSAIVFIDSILYRVDFRGKLCLEIYFTDENKNNGRCRDG